MAGERQERGVQQARLSWRHSPVWVAQRGGGSLGNNAECNVTFILSNMTNTQTDKQIHDPSQSWEG